MWTVLIPALISFVLKEAPSVGALIAKLFNAGQTEATPEQLAEAKAEHESRLQSDAALDAASGVTG